ncbi:MAG: hypothetical protein KDA70_12275, partial [Planctomycetaceae bacterium]|nr:hypothetical protein [Planctomycetaceae bacterium]
VLLFSPLIIQAEVPTQTYKRGFETITVFEYKKALEEAEEEIPKFPPRTSNAVIISSVERDSPASQAGLRERDLVRIINGKYLRSLGDAEKIMKSANSDEPLQLGVVRRVSGNWNHIKIVVQPLTEVQRLKQSLLIKKGYDESFDSCEKVKHKDAPTTIFSSDTILLYYIRKKSNPDHLCFRVVMWDPGNIKPGQLVITTDSSMYSIKQPPDLYIRKLNSFDEVEKKLEHEQAKNERLRVANRKAHTQTSEEYDRLEKEFNNNFKEFDYEKSRKDEAAQKKLMQKLKLLDLMTKSSEQLIEYSKEHQEMLASLKLLAEKKISLNKNKLKIIDDYKVKRLAIYDELTTEQQQLLQDTVEKVQENREVKENELLKIEETGFVDDWIRKQRMKQGWKWYDATLNQGQLKMIKDILSSEKVTVHHDSNPEKKFDVSDNQKEQMRTILTAFEAEGGKVGE